MTGRWGLGLDSLGGGVTRREYTDYQDNGRHNRVRSNPCRHSLPILSKEARRLNHAITVTPWACEKHRISHTGNGFEFGSDHHRHCKFERILQHQTCANPLFRRRSQLPASSGTNARVFCADALELAFIFLAVEAAQWICAQNVHIVCFG